MRHFFQHFHIDAKFRVALLLVSLLVAYIVQNPIITAMWLCVSVLWVISLVLGVCIAIQERQD